MRPKAFLTSTLIGGLAVFLTGVSMFADPFVELVPGAVAGAVIALTLKIFDSENRERAVIH